jgi:hypothetical protein
MNFVIKTHTKQPTRQKQVADTSHVDMSQVSISDNVIAKVADINKKDLFNNKPIEKSNLLMNVTDLFDTTTGEKILSNEAIYAESYYIDSSGDLIKTAYINGIKCVSVELCDKSLTEIEALCNLNITDDTNVRNSSGVQRVRVVVANDSVKLVKVTLGFYRNYLKDRQDLLKLNVTGVRTTYQDAQNKTVYETEIMCKAEDIVEVTNIIKSINKSSMIVEWYM